MKKLQKKTGGAAVKWHSILRPYYGRALMISALSVLQAVIQVGLALIMRGLIDAAVNASPSLEKWTVLLIVDLVLQVVIHGVTSWYSSSTADRFSASLRGKLLKSALYSADSRLQEFHSGELLSRGMEDVYTICDSVVNALPTLVGQIARLITAFGVVLLIYPSIAGVLLIAALVAVAAVTIMRPVLKARHRSVRMADEQVMATMQEDLQQLELVQSLRVEEEILNRFDKRQRISLKEKFKRRILSVGSNSVLNIVSMLGTGALLIWGATQVAVGMLSYGSLTSMLQLLNQFRSPVLSLSGLWTRFTATQVAGERLAVLLDVPSEEDRQKPEYTPTALVFENVTFSYPGDPVPVVENFSMRFPLEGWACLTGMSGRGKTTLFKLILGLYTPQQGRIYLETDRGQLPCDASTRCLFAYVPQDYALFSGTVLENLLLVAPQADEKVRKNALTIAKADFVLDMPQGENTNLRENNTGLSKGQIQRLAIARAVLMNRPVLLLDECTSALDAETEKEVLKNLRELGKHAIVVTHRPEALQDLDGIIPVSMEE